MKKFWLYFLSAYGTIWFVMLFISIATQSKVDAGEFGFFGFSFITLIYALIKIKFRSKNINENIG
jgi:hypothetical protein